MPGPVSKLLISMTDLWLFLAIWDFETARWNGLIPPQKRSAKNVEIFDGSEDPQSSADTEKLNSCLITEFPTWSESLWSIWISWIWQIDQDPYYFSHVEGDIDEILSISDLGKVQRPHLVLRNVWEATSGTPLKSPTLLTGVMGILFVCVFFVQFV